MDYSHNLAQMRLACTRDEGYEDAACQQTYSKLEEFGSQNKRLPANGHKSTSFGYRSNPLVTEKNLKKIATSVIMYLCSTER